MSNDLGIAGHCITNAGANVSEVADRIDVSIIVVNYKTPKLTLECLASVYAQCAAGTFEVILVDNHSSDGSVGEFKKRFPQTTLIELEENIGFARANNLAAARAKGEYLLLLNPDTVVLDNAIFKLLAFAKRNPSGGIWGGRTLNADGSLNPSSCWRSPSLWSTFCALVGLRRLFPKSPLFDRESYGGWQRNFVREVDIITGCFLLIRRDLWNRLGGFDPTFFMYGEDFDLSLRAKALGYRPLMTPEATIVHYGSVSEWLPARKQAQLLAAGITIVDRHWPWPKRAIGKLLLRTYPYSRAISFWLLAAALKNEKAVRGYETWKAVIRQRRVWISGFPPLSEA